jgi:hypothetical protein
MTSPILAGERLWLRPIEPRDLAANAVPAALWEIGEPDE